MLHFNIRTSTQRGENGLRHGVLLTLRVRKSVTRSVTSTERVQKLVLLQSLFPVPPSAFRPHFIFPTQAVAASDGITA